jgi:hypothetical protein
MMARVQSGNALRADTKSFSTPNGLAACKRSLQVSKIATKACSVRKPPGTLLK